MSSYERLQEFKVQLMGMFATSLDRLMVTIFAGCGEVPKLLRANHLA